ncbi:peptidylprolyl isomerase [Gorillibacterium sp. sgz5001074]|uniref:peptidylprolyl isomerase n=1 Tax=Gorillibacterium sp. sgz5001074 TaxID=3446695 RepID=UPI003F667675
MKDKLKGLVIGALLGSAITGTAAYASANTQQIEVLFRPLKILFDGVEKQPEKGTPFIYDGSTYVPLRFVSESLGKEVGWDEETGTITIDEPGSKTAIAEYKDGDKVYTITQSRVNKQMSIAMLYRPSLQNYISDPNFRDQIIQEVAAFLITAGRADDAMLQAAKEQAPALLQELKSAYAQNVNGDQAWGSRLQELKLTENDLLEFLRLNTVRAAYFNRQITEDQLRAAYLSASTSHEYDTATVRHVLVGFETQDGKTRTKEEALTRAKEVASKLKAGADFGVTAKTYSDDPGSKDQGGRYENEAISGWVTGFKNAVLSQEIGAIGEPVETEYGYHVIQVEARHTPKLEEIRNELHSRLQSSAYTAFLEQLPSLRTQP